MKYEKYILHDDIKHIINHTKSINKKLYGKNINNRRKWFSGKYFQ